MMTPEMQKTPMRLKVTAKMSERRRVLCSGGERRGRESHRLMRVILEFRSVLSNETLMSKTNHITKKHGK